MAGLAPVARTRAGREREGARGADGTREAETGGRGQAGGQGEDVRVKSHGETFLGGGMPGRAEGQVGQQPSDSGGIWSTRSRCSFHREGSAGQTWAQDRGSEKQWVQAHPAPTGHRRTVPPPRASTHGSREDDASREAGTGGLEGLPHGHPATEATHGLPSDWQRDTAQARQGVPLSDGAPVTS